ncbi:CLUMA_CG005146, isoform A [Clunio marinus]|uniref:CLUMA_CG005146, isoform A n=1 Tax=Clunio marinus TaxID=568069 RepID=A0A1J1HTT4_9DIPT|nr:CLUMA_CG005146, isoform A [Clunio marinus]
MLPLMDIMTQNCSAEREKRLREHLAMWMKMREKLAHAISENYQTHSQHPNRDYRKNFSLCSDAVLTLLLNNCSSTCLKN